MTLASSINYLSPEGFPWVLAAWAGLYLLRPFATLFHELGHFWGAFLLTKKPVSLVVGKSSEKPLFQGSRIHFDFSFRQGVHGATIYSDQGLSLFPKILILSGGPLFSFAMCCLAGWLILGFSQPTWLEILEVSWFCANFLVFARNSLPMRLKASKEYPEGPPSDGLQLLWLISGKSRPKE